MPGMKWSDKCILELTHRNLFENDAHRSRFRDLLECYFIAPFFTKGLCKCMYLSAWDDVHFTQMLDILNEMTIDRAETLTLMNDNGVVLQHKAAADENRADVMILSLSFAFLNDLPFDQTALRGLEVSDPEGAYIIKRALQAAECIDRLPEL